MNGSNSIRSNTEHNRKGKRSHFNGRGKSKMCFDSKEDGEEWIRRHHWKDYVCYLCPECNHFHIGRKS